MTKTSENNENGIDKEMMQDSTRTRLLEGVKENISMLENRLSEEIIPLINDKNYNKFKNEIEIALIFTVMNLDFFVNVKNYLNGKYFWEGTVAFKQIYKIIFESHNKISYCEGKNNNITQNNKIQSLWFSKIYDLVIEETQPEYNKISKLLDDFKTKSDFNYIAKIRNHDGHYSGMVEFINDMKVLDPNKTLNLAIDWGKIMIEVYNFSIAQLNKKIPTLLLN